MTLDWEDIKQLTYEGCITPEPYYQVMRYDAALLANLTANFGWMKTLLSLRDVNNDINPFVE